MVGGDEFEDLGERCKWKVVLSLLKSTHRVRRRRMLVAKRYDHRVQDLQRWHEELVISVDSGW